ncbi:MAG: DUF4258 domain-containing protein [Flavobacteriaceae bacterium]|nr:hypothetical protein [Bacteroidia bacterium]MBT8288596.1 hypothetical protein [Bacteroidia bacterium]NNF76004.1 DUF4258 domain-containing protein [Flavobacteriaceae bacterium]NNM08761.1 DUF4258 domain-containing protein [Flavobacteriaceae bacterium]
MKFIHRLGYYLGGLAVGLVFLAFFLTGKRASCDYSPNARVLKNIRTKTLVYSEDIKEQLIEQGIDSIDIQSVLQYGDVKFKKSNTKLDSCRTYYIEGKHDEKDVYFTIANCEYEAMIIKLEAQ